MRKEWFLLIPSRNIREELTRNTITISMMNWENDGSHGRYDDLIWEMYYTRSQYWKNLTESSTEARFTDLLCSSGERWFLISNTLLFWSFLDSIGRDSWSFFLICRRRCCCIYRINFPHHSSVNSPSSRHETRSFPFEIVPLIWWSWKNSKTSVFIKLVVT